MSNAKTLKIEGGPVPGLEATGTGTATEVSTSSGISPVDAQDLAVMDVRMTPTQGGDGMTTRIRYMNPVAFAKTVRKGWIEA